jgi:hypothetical protein
MEAALKPFPMEDTTPPLINITFGMPALYPNGGTSKEFPKEFKNSPGRKIHGDEFFNGENLQKSAKIPI